MRLRHLLPVLLCFAVPAVAQQPADSTTLADTVGVTRQVFITEYSFHAARHLTALQVAPLLLRTADPTINRLVRRSKRRHHLTVPFIVGGYGLLIGAVRAGRVNQESALAGGLALGSITALTDGIVMGLSAPRPMRRAVNRYNQLLADTDSPYFSPQQPTAPALSLTERDTIRIRPTLLGNRYVYRGVEVAPELQLRTALESVRDPFVTEGLRQNRVVRGVGGLLGGLSVTVISSYYLTRFLSQAAGQRVPKIGPLTYAAFGGVAVSFALGRIADRTTRQVVRRYNQRLTGN